MKLTIAVSGLHRGENPQPGAGIIRSLRRRYRDLTIVGLVYDVLESGIYAEDCADVVYQLPYPSAGSDALRARLDEILAQRPIDILIPALDAEIFGLIKLEDELAARGVKMMLPRMAPYQACRKTELAELAKRCRCRTPLSFNAVEVTGLQRAAAEMGYPLIIKGPYYGAYQVSSEASLVERFHQIVAAWGGPVVVQQYVPGSQYDVIAVGDGQGDVGGLCAVRKTIISEQGKGFGGISVRDQQLTQIAMRLIDALKWRGPIELEFLKDETGDAFVLMEINPRFPAWVDFPSSFGHNLPSLVVEALLHGRMPKLPDCPTGKFFVRHSIDLLGDVRQLGQLSSCGQLDCSGAASRRAAAGGAGRRLICKNLASNS